ncbi:MAG: PIN domain-containing protein [Candidatus Altiarchaeota archaeon]
MSTDEEQGKKVVLDTNFLLIPAQFKLDIFENLDAAIPGKKIFVTPQGVIEELKSIKLSSKGIDGIAAKVALELIAEKHVEIIPSEGEVDDFIVEYASENKACVATCDKELKKRLKNKGIKTVTLRCKRYLIVD